MRPEASGTRVYEVRCEYCRTSFAPETRRCVHCGRPLGASHALMGAAVGDPLPGGGIEGAPAHPADEEGGPQALEIRGRNALWVATALLAVIGSALRMCQG